MRAASEYDSTTVKVGYYENEVFEEGAAKGAVKTGYAYEYYRKLSEYTGWKYEYVYGSYSELYDKLLEGEIDFLAGLAKKDERIGLIGYPSDAMGSETYTLVKHDDDPDITYATSSMSGKKIGVLKSAVADVLNNYLKEQSLDVDVITFDDYESLFEAFDSKKVDILAAEGDGAYGRSHAEVICTFGHSDYYLCVNIKRKDLLDELNVAQALLAAEEPNYLSTLQNKYYSASVSSHSFSVSERKWIEENKSLKVGYINNYLPYSATDDNGDATGIVIDIIPKILSELQIDDIAIDYKGYDNYDEMIDDICLGVIDVGFPVGGGLYYSEESGIYQSAPLVSSSTDLVYEGQYKDEDYNHFAVNKNNRMQYYYINTHFPEAKITFYPNIDACLEAVIDGEVEATTLNGMRANEILKNRKYKGLYLKQLNQADDRCFGVKIGNEGLLKIMNRGINVVGSEYTLDLAYDYATKLYSYTFVDMVKDNQGLFLSMLLLIALLVIVLIFRDLKRTRQADRMKSDFVSNMSHEIRTPITAIIGMNEMIRRESDDEKILSYSDNIERASETLMGIINDILDFSKIEAGRMELDVHSYSLPELLSDLQLMIEMRAAEKNLSFSMDVDQRIPVMPIGDMQKLKQVILNLLTNAVKYTEEGYVRLTLKLLSIEEDNFLMEISVEDTGIGIKDQEMRKLYSAFDRLDMENNRNIEGSGLGLAISENLLSLMNSKMQVKSQYGRGSCFSFVISQGISDRTEIGPFEPVKNEAGRKYDRRKATFTAPNAKILVVDDTPMNLQVICGLLKDNKMIIDTAESGKECVDLVGDNEYDVIFLDQRMPNMDGVETLNALKLKYPEKLSKTIIISLTANALTGVREEMLEAGFTDYLTKPVKLSNMENMLLKYLPKEKIQRIDGMVEENEDTIPIAVSRISELNIEKGLEYCGDVSDYIDALDIYRSSVKERAEILQGYLKNLDAENIALLIHSVKSTSRAIGAEEIYKLALKIEEYARAKDTDKLSEVVPDFINRYSSLGEELDKAINQLDM